MEEKEIRETIDAFEKKLESKKLKKDEIFWFTRYVKVLKEELKTIEIKSFL